MQKAITFLHDNIRNIPKLPTRRNGDRPAPGLAAVINNPKLRNDLLAWCALTRELLDSIETL